MRIKKKLSLLKQKVENTILAKLNSSSKKISNKFVKRKYRSFKERKKVVSFSYSDFTRKGLPTYYKVMPSIGRFYKTKLQTKRYVQSLFDNSLEFTNKTYSGEKIQYMTKTFGTPFFRIDILL